MFPLQVKSIFYVHITCIGLIMLIAVFHLNRAFMVGSLAGLIFLFHSHYNEHNSEKRIPVSFILLLCLTLFLAVYVKRDSSLGRLLIYKISWQMLEKNPWFGIGWNNFQKEYNINQSLYFQKGGYTQKEFLLADNTFYAFNDYWQFIVETGVVGGIALTFIIVILLNIIRSQLNEHNNKAMRLPISILIIIMVAALFTHVFEKKIFQFIVLTIVLNLLLGYLNLKLNKLMKQVMFSFILVGVSLLVYKREIIHFQSYQKLEEAKILSKLGYLLESKEKYENLYLNFKTDVTFLRDYSDLLLAESEKENRLRVFNQILETYTDNSTLLKAGLIYEDLGMSKVAEKHLLNAVYMVPNRVVPKEILYYFYLRNRQYDRALIWRNEILKMPIKIPSKRISDIKQKLLNIKPK